MVFPRGNSLGPVLFLIYINDLPHCSSVLSFRIFADVTNVFASAHDLRSLEQLINTELKKIKGAQSRLNGLKSLAKLFKFRRL